MQHKSLSAIEYYNKALTFDPNYARAKCHLGEALKDLGRFEEAIDAAQQSLQLDPHYAWGHFVLGGRAQGAWDVLDEAVGHYKLIYDQLPDLPEPRQEYQTTLLQLGRAEEARLAWARTLQSSGAGVELWTGYPELCLFAGNEQEYRRARTTMLQRFRLANHAGGPLNNSRAPCLLLPICAGRRGRRGPRHISRRQSHDKGKSRRCPPGDTPITSLRRVWRITGTVVSRRRPNLWAATRRKCWARVRNSSWQWLSMIRARTSRRAGALADAVLKFRLATRPGRIRRTCGSITSCVARRRPRCCQIFPH